MSSRPPTEGLNLERPLRRGYPSEHWWQGERLLVWLTGAVLALLVVVPIGMLAFASVRGPIGALPILSRAYFTLEHYQDALFRVSSWQMALDTAVYITGAVLVATLVGLALAWLTIRARTPMPNLLAALVVIPFLFPPAAITGSWVRLLRPRSGTLNVFLREHFFPGMTSGPLDTANLPMLILAQGLIMTPIAFLVLAAALRNLNRTSEELSEASGATPLTTLRRITLPLLAPALLTSAALGVWFSLDWIDVPFDLGAVGAVRLFTIRLYFQTIGSIGGFPNFGGAAAHAVLALLVLAILFFLYSRWTRHGYEAIGVQGSSAVRRKGGPWMAPLLAVAVVYVLAMWVAPGYGLISGVVRGGWDAVSAVAMSERFWQATANSLSVAVGSATLGTAIVLAVAWLVVRAPRGAWRGVMDVLATAPLVVPGLLAASAFLLVYLWLDWLPLWGTHLGIILALSYRLAIPYRLTNVGMRQVDPSMEEASAASGASHVATLRRIVLPLLAPTLGAAWIVFFVFAIRERTLITYVAFQVRTFTTMGNVAPEPGANAAAELAVLLMSLAVVVAVRRLSLRSRRLE